MGHAAHDRSFGDCQGIGQRIVRLPTEVKGWDGEQGLLLAVRKFNLVLEVFPPQMHVGHQAQQVDILLELERGLHRVVVVTWRDDEPTLWDRHGVGFVLDRPLREDQPHLGAIGLHLAGGRVVDLEDEA